MSNPGDEMRRGFRGVDRDKAILWAIILIPVILYLVSVVRSGGRTDPDATPSWSHGHAGD